MADSPADCFGSLRSVSRSNINPTATRTPWPSRRHTPYTKTPRTGRVSRHLGEKFGSNKASNAKAAASQRQKRAATALDSGIKTFKGKETPVNSKRAVPSSKCFEAESVVNKTWRVYCLSPFFNFEYEEQAFKNYGRLLSAHLQAESQSQKGLAVEVGATNQIFKANFTVVKGISLLESDFESVEITIRTSTSAGKSRISESPTLVALFCSVGREDNENADPVLRKSFTSLPMCLVKGPVILTRTLINWLETQFDCRMSFMTFSTVELSWFAALWASVVPQGHSRPVELCYSLPSSVQGLNRITLDIEAKDAKHLWQCVHSSDSDIFTEPEAQVFLKAVEVHFYRHFKVDLSAIPLTRVGTSVAYVGSEGRLKILHPDFVQHVLQQVMQTAITRELSGRL